MKNAITRDDLKLFLATGAVLIGFGVLITKVDTNIETTRELASQVRSLETSVTRLDEALAGARRRGEITFMPQEQLISLANPSLTVPTAGVSAVPNRGQQNTYNASFIDPTPVPTPMPQPTAQPRESLIPCVLGVCIL